jgi:hypothetical protein
MAKVAANKKFNNNIKNIKPSTSFGLVATD